MLVTWNSVPPFFGSRSLLPWIALDNAAVRSELINAPAHPVPEPPAHYESFEEIDNDIGMVEAPEALRSLDRGRSPPPETPPASMAVSQVEGSSPSPRHRNRPRKWYLRWLSRKHRREQPPTFREAHGSGHWLKTLLNDVGKIMKKI